MEVNPPGGRRARPGLDGLGVLDPRLPQMHMHVDEARRDHQPRCVEHLGVGEIEIGADRRDAVVFERNIGHRVESGIRIDHAPVLN